MAKMKPWVSARYEKAKLAHAALMKCYPFDLKNIADEIWQDIYGYDGLYQISTYGRIKSFKRKKTIILRPTVTPEGYLRVGLKKNSTSKSYYVHILVGEAFIPNPEGKPEINHEDGCKFNNHVSNLKWVTGLENKRHSVKLGLHRAGSNFRDAKLSEEEVRYIRSVYKPRDKEFGATALAKKFNMRADSILKVIHRKTYKNVK